MAEYIDREAVADKLLELADKLEYISGEVVRKIGDITNKDFCFVDKLPIEANPIMRSYWKCEGKGQYYGALCNKPTPTDLYSYCPWCGADMRGG